MPVRRCTNGKFRIGTGKCNFRTRAGAERAQRAVKAKEGSKQKTPRNRRR